MMGFKCSLAIWGRPDLLLPLPPYCDWEQILTFIFLGIKVAVRTIKEKLRLLNFVLYE